MAYYFGLEFPVTRRSFLKRSALAGGALLLAPAIEGCDAQQTMVFLLQEMQNDWQAVDSAAGGNLPTKVNEYFNDAIQAVKAWKVGTAGQDVVQALQLLNSVVIPLIPVLTPEVQILAQILLGSIINIIEYVDPSATPTPPSVTLMASLDRTIVNAKYAAISGSFPGGARKGKYRASKDAKAIKADFETRWNAAKKS